MNKPTIILVTGACGQIGTALVKALSIKYGRKSVIATDLRPRPAAEGPCLQLNVMDKQALAGIAETFQVTQIYHLAAILSASGEKDPLNAWELNMQSLLNVLEVARINHITQVFWPSSIAVFGACSPKDDCPQHAATGPDTVYGISKCAGEYWCQYYYTKYGLDIRSLRYPGLVSHSAKPGGGTTDYAVDIFHQALDKSSYTCYLKDNTRLPMLYMPDAVRAALELMDAPREKITIRTSYNLAGMSFTPEDLAKEIRDFLPEFRMDYLPDSRQQIADSWPDSIGDRQARQDWNWRPAYDLETMTADMVSHLQVKQID